jgi:hypothetical protein
VVELDDIHDPVGRFKPLVGQHGGKGGLLSVAGEDDFGKALFRLVDLSRRQSCWRLLLRET